MFDRLIYFSIHHKLVIGLLTLVLVAWGGYSLRHLPIDAVPDITTNQVVVYTVAPSLAAADIERLVTFPVEQAVATIPERTEIRSFSRFGLSVITIVFHDDVDVYWARQQVAERLRVAESQIPAGVGRPELAPLSTGLGEIYQYIIRPRKGFEKQYGPRELRAMQDGIIRRQLLGTPGVADVSSFGGLVKQYEIALDPERLRAFGVSVADVQRAVEANNQNAGGTYLDQQPAAYFIRTEGLATSLADLGTIVVRRTTAGLPVLVRDVADVRLGAAVRYGAMTRNDEGEVTGGLVLMLKGANANEVIRGVKARMAQIEQTLPPGVTVDVFLDRSELVGRAIGTVEKNLLEGALIVVLVLVLFLGNLRAGLVVASVIPLAMLFAVALMRLFGVSGNLLSLGAIDFGLVVDGAVIIVEAIVHRLALRGGQEEGLRVAGLEGLRVEVVEGGAAETASPITQSLSPTQSLSHSITQSLSQEEMDAETYTAASRIRQSAAFGEFIILIVYLPLLALVGVEGKMFRPMAETVAFAILGAFLLSLTYVPMMSALALSRRPTHRRNLSDRMMDWLGARYRPALDVALRHPTAVLGLSGALLVAAGLGFRALGGEFIPTLSEGDFAVEMRTLPGSSLTYTIEKAQQASGLLKRQFPAEVREVVAKIGSSEIPTDPMPPEAADLIVVLEKDRTKWRAATSMEALTAKMAAAVAAVPGVTFSFQQPIQMRFNELISGAKQDVVVKIYGEDLDQLADYARAVGQLVRAVSGAKDVYVEAVKGLPQIVVQIDRARLAPFGLSVADVNRTVETAFAGAVAGQIFEQERRYDIVLRLRPELRQNVESVRRLLLTTPNGEAVPLEQVANVALRDGPNQVQRDDAQRRITVAFNVRGRDVESVVRDLQTRLDRRLKLAPGYRLGIGGQFENLRAASARLQIAVPVALGLIFVLLFFTFGSWRQALLIFSAIPLAAVGGVAALWLRGMPFSISAGVGFIALFGVAVLNGIVLIGQFNTLRDEGVTDVLTRIRRGTADRLRPVLMTATVASLGFLPMALSQSAGAEIQRPLATVVIGGLLTATLLTLLVLPVLYAWLEGWGARPASPPPASPSPAVAVLVTMLFVVLLTLPARAQNVPLAPPGRGPLTATGAVDAALLTGGTVTGATRALEAQQAIRRAAFDLPRTSVNGNYGQYNTFRRDNQLSVSQQFALPGYYRRQAAVADAQITGRQLQLAQARAELRRQVRLRYQDAVAARHRLRTLRGQDSLYTEFRRAAELRFKAGEVARLEPATALVQQGEVQLAASQAQTDLRVALRELQALLQAPDSVLVADSVLRPLPLLRPLPAPADTAWLANAPAAGPLRQAVAERRAETRLERARGLPDLSVGYFNQSLRGPQELDDRTTRFYSGADRFQGIQAGISVPLWRRPLRARVQAAGLQEQVATAAYERARADLAGRLDVLRLRRAEALRRVAFYETTGLPQAAVIERLSTRGFRAGETGYAEYLLSLDRARRLRLDYLDALLKLNQTIIEIDYLLGE